MADGDDKSTGATLRATEDPNVHLTPNGNAVRRARDGAKELYPAKYVEEGRLTRWFPVVPPKLVFDQGELLEPGSVPVSMNPVPKAEEADAYAFVANALGETEADVRAWLAP